MSDIFVRAAAFVPGTLNRDARTVEVTAISGPAPVTRTGRAPDGTMRRWIEQLDATVVDWGAFAGAPVLKDHNPTTDSTVGVIESARLEGKAASAVHSIASGHLLWMILRAQDDIYDFKILS